MAIIAVVFLRSNVKKAYELDEEYHPSSRKPKKSEKIGINQRVQKLA